MGALGRGVRARLPEQRAERVALGLLLALLSLLGVALARGFERRTALVVFALAWVSLVAPVATVWWDARLAIPGI